MKLSLEAGQPGFALPLEIQSMSPSGLVVLTASQPPRELDERLLADPKQENEVLTFLLEKDGRQTTLQANLVWLELSKEETQRRLELIVDTGDQPGWWEVHTALSGE
jgi:hypothetical protein